MFAVAVLAALATTACATGGEKVGGARPPQGPGPAGTNFGYWANDAEGAVDASFRSFITKRYDYADMKKAQADLTTDGFECKDGNRPDGRPVPQLECLRLYKMNEDVSAWSVEFWPNEREPRAKYTRTLIKDPFVDHAKKKKPSGPPGSGSSKPKGKSK